MISSADEIFLQNIAENEMKMSDLIVRHFHFIFSYVLQKNKNKDAIISNLRFISRTNFMLS